MAGSDLLEDSYHCQQMCESLCENKLDGAHQTQLAVEMNESSECKCGEGDHTVVLIVDFCQNALRDAQAIIDRELGSLDVRDGEASLSDSESFTAELQILESVSQDLSNDLLEAEAEWRSLQSASFHDELGNENLEAKMWSGKDGHDATETDATDEESSYEGSFSEEEVEAEVGCNRATHRGVGQEDSSKESREDVSNAAFPSEEDREEPCCEKSINENIERNKSRSAPDADASFLIQGLDGMFGHLSSPPSSPRQRHHVTSLSMKTANGALASSVRFHNAGRPDPFMRILPTFLQKRFTGPTKKQQEDTQSWTVGVPLMGSVDGDRLLFLTSQEQHHKLEDEGPMLE